MQKNVPYSFVVAATDQGVAIEISVQGLEDMTVVMNPDEAAKLGELLTQCAAIRQEV